MLAAFRVSLFFLLCALGLGACATFLYHQYARSPVVSTPITFSRARIYTETFRTSKTDRYFVGVRYDELADDGEDEQYRKRLKASIARCVVSDSRGNVVSGHDASGGGGNKVFCGLMAFDANNCETYTVTLDVTPPNADLDAQDPQLVVELNTRSYGEITLTIFLLACGVLFCVAVSVVALVVSAVLYWKR